MMNENQFSRAIKTIRGAIKSRYSFPYYALVRVTTKRGRTFHIPAPWFEETLERSRFAIDLPIAPDRRDEEYYSCPVCKEPGFYSGICSECLDVLYGTDGIRYFDNLEALKNAEKMDVLRRIDNRVKDLGIAMAEIVLPVEFDLTKAAFFKESSQRVEDALRNLELLQESIQEEFEDEEEEEIFVEGSDEIRKRVNGVWFHRHGTRDYWHPMARVHREEML